MLNTAAGEATFEFSRLSQGKASLDALLVVRLQRAAAIVPHFQRINLESESARTRLVSGLRRDFGELAWERAVALAFWAARVAYLERDESEWIDGCSGLDSAPCLVDPLLVDRTMNLIYGRGGTMKSYLALTLAYMVGACEPVGALSPERAGPAIYVDYEADRDQLDVRWARMCQGFGHVLPPKQALRYFPGRAIPVADQIDTLARRVEREGSPLVVIDSATFAVGGLVNDAEAVGAYFSALSSLSCASLTIAHTNRSGDESQALGFVGWRNSPRRTWLARQALSDTQAGRYRTGLVCTKNNDGPWPDPLGYEVQFSDRQRGGDGSVRFAWTAAPETTAIVAAGGGSQWEQVRSLLVRTPLTTPELQQYTGIPMPSLRVLLSKRKGDGDLIQLENQRWGLTARGQDAGDEATA